MKEYQREHAILEIAKKTNEKKSLAAKKSELEELKKDPTIIKYLNLLEEIKTIEEEYRYHNTDEKIIDNVFRKLIENDFKCDHEIWLYEGSYYLSIDMLHEHDQWCRKTDEHLPVKKGDFEYKHNTYICLECGKKIETKDWENFEKSHFVLKTQNEYIYVYEYISLYYQYLYQMPIKEAQEKVIQMFNIEKAKGKTKELKK